VVSCIAALAALAVGAWAASANTKAINGCEIKAYTSCQGADLRGAHLHGADLRGADLRGADLRGAHLHGADLHGADLRGADLRGAVLSYADLTRADLRDVNDWPDADLRGVLFCRTTMPDVSMNNLGCNGVRVPAQQNPSGERTWHRVSFHLSPVACTGVYGFRLGVCLEDPSTSDSFAAVTHTNLVWNAYTGGGPINLQLYAGNQILVGSVPSRASDAFTVTDGAVPDWRNTDAITTGRDAPPGQENGPLKLDAHEVHDDWGFTIDGFLSYSRIEQIPTTTRLSGPTTAMTWEDPGIYRASISPYLADRYRSYVRFEVLGPDARNHCQAEMVTDSQSALCSGGLKFAEPGTYTVIAHYLGSPVSLPSDSPPLTVTVSN
jgi:hypothetical protein